jgi:hypothetical protein
VDETSHARLGRGAHDVLGGIDRVALVLRPAAGGFGRAVHDGDGAFEEVGRDARAQIGHRVTGAVHALPCGREATGQNAYGEAARQQAFGRGPAQKTGSAGDDDERSRARRSDQLLGEGRVARERRRHFLPDRHGLFQRFGRGRCG